MLRRAGSLQSTARSGQCEYTAFLQYALLSEPHHDQDLRKRPLVVGPLRETSPAMQMQHSAVR